MSKFIRKLIESILPRVFFFFFNLSKNNIAVYVSPEQLHLNLTTYFEEK